MRDEMRGRQAHWKYSSLTVRVQGNQEREEDAWSIERSNKIKRQTAGGYRPSFPIAIFVARYPVAEH